VLDAAGMGTRLSELAVPAALFEKDLLLDVTRVAWARCLEASVNEVFTDRSTDVSFARVAAQHIGQRAARRSVLSVAIHRSLPSCVCKSVSQREVRKTYLNLTTSESRAGQVAARSNA